MKVNCIGALHKACATDNEQAQTLVGTVMVTTFLTGNNKLK